MKAHIKPMLVDIGGSPYRVFCLFTEEEKYVLPNGNRVYRSGSAKVSELYEVMLAFARDQGYEVVGEREDGL